VADTAERGPWQDRVVARSLGDASAKSIARAEALMQATVELLSETGDDVTVQDVADRAGVSLRVLYRHFDGKAGLLIAVLEDAMTRQTNALRRDLDAIEDPIQRIAAYVLWTIDVPSSKLNVGLAKNVSLLSLSHPEVMASAQAPNAALVTELVQYAVEAGRIDRARLVSGGYLLTELRRTHTFSQLFGNEFGLRSPPPVEQVGFGLRSLGVEDEAIRKAITAVKRRVRGGRRSRGK
jgi:AcrR family transcriptional regulator